MFNFYLFQKNKVIIVSDFPLDKIKSKFGHQFEILNSVKDKDSVEVVLQRLLRSYPNHKVETYYHVPRKPVSEEGRLRMSLARKGYVTPEEVKKKISLKMKGKSNFEGKKHTAESKSKIAEKKYGNDHAKNKKWVHNPETYKEKRVLNLKEIPEGFLLGRDYDSVEMGLYYIKNKLRSEK